jgi:hypothetical protein
MKTISTGVGLAALAIAFLCGNVWTERGNAQKNPEAPKVLTAQEFRLVDKDGKPRAKIGVGETGGSSVTLMDGEGKVRAQLTVQSDGSAALVLQDKAEKPRAVLNAVSEGSAGLALFDKGNQSRAVLNARADSGSTLPSGDSVLRITAPDGEVTWDAP